MFWLRKVLVFWTWNYHVLSIYWLSTGGFVPSDACDNFIAIKVISCGGVSECFLHIIWPKSFKIRVAGVVRTNAIRSRFYFAFSGVSSSEIQVFVGVLQV
jgi:hypothetical protein